MKTNHWAKIRTIFRPALLILFAPGAFAQVSFYLQKEGNYFQTSAATPSASFLGGLPFTFLANSSVAGVFIPPGLPSVPFSADSANNDYDFAETFFSQQQMDSYFPNGIYRTQTTVLPSVAASLVGNLFPPAIPQIASGGTWQNNVLVVNPAVDTTLTFNGFASYASQADGQVAGEMGLQLQIPVNEPGVYNEQTFDAGEQVQTASGFIGNQSLVPYTSYTITAGTLNAGTVYIGTLNYTAFAELSLPAGTNGVLSASYEDLTKFFIVGQMSNPPGIPVITKQPVNVAGALGSNVTITASYSATNDPQQLTVVLWGTGGVLAPSSKYVYGPGQPDHH